MKRLKLKITSKGVIKGLWICEREDYEYDSEQRTLTNMLKKLKDSKLENKLKEVLLDDVNYDDCIAIQESEGAYIKLLDENTETSIVVQLTHIDHDGNQLYLESCYDKNIDDSIITDEKLENNEVIKEILRCITDYKSRNKTEINNDVIEFNESETIWLDMTLIEAIRTLGLQDRYPEETVKKLEENCSLMGNDKYDDIDKEVCKIEREMLKPSEIIKRYTGKTVLLKIDRCGGVTELRELDKFNADDFRYEINCSSSLLKN